MTLRERLLTIGRGLTGNSDISKIPTETINEVNKLDKTLREKTVFGSFVDFRNTALTTQTKASSKLLEANRGWVFRNNDVIAKEVAKIEFELYQVRFVNGQIEFNELTTHPLLDALDQFNKFTSSSDGFYVTQSHKKLAGDAFWYVAGNGINVDGIFILPPDKVELKLGKAEIGTQIIQGYEYKDTINNQPVKITYTPDEIVHFKQPNPNNYFRGLGAVEAGAEDIDLDNLAIEANKQLFRRGLISNFILTTPNNINEDQLKRLRAEFNKNYSGIENAFNVPILSGDLKPQSITLTNREMELIAQQEWVRDKIASIFGNNKAVLGITDDVNRANAEATIDNWKLTTVAAEMKQITDTLNEFFVPRWGDNLMLGFCDPISEDRTEKLSEVQILISENVITTNEARELLGYEDIDGGDELKAPPPPVTIMPQPPEVPKSLRNISWKKHIKRTGVLAKKQAYVDIKKTTDQIARKALTDKKKAIPETYQNYYAKLISRVEMTEKLFDLKLNQIFDRILQKALVALPHEVIDMQNKSLFDEEDETMQAVIDLSPILDDLAIASGTDAMSLVKPDMVYVNRRKAEIRKRVELFASSMIKTDQDKLIDIISGGVQAGQSIAQISANITDDFAQFTQNQADRITRTEVLNTSNQAAIDAWDQSGVVEGKQWVCAADPDAECADFEGEVVSLSDGFYFSDNDFAEGDPPIHPNCRCSLIPVLTGEKELTKDELLTIALKSRIKDLEEKIDKRTKTYRDMKAKNLSQEAYIKELEDYLDQA